MKHLDNELLATVNKFFENNLNVSETSRQLYIHRNTLVYRLDKLQPGHREVVEEIGCLRGADPEPCDERVLVVAHDPGPVVGDDEPVSGSQDDLPVREVRDDLLQGPLLRGRSLGELLLGQPADELPQPVRRLHEGIERVQLAERFAVTLGDHGSGAPIRHLGPPLGSIRASAIVTEARPAGAAVESGLVKIGRDVTGTLEDLLARAFGEDGEDVTTLAVFGPRARLEGEMVCREEAVVAGVALLPRIFSFLRPEARVELLVEDGAPVAPDTVLARVEGPAVNVLAAERTALNLVQRLSGIATSTRTFVSALVGTNAVLLDTRKTTPGLRALERYAVRCGGGQNHRFGLAHAFLVKDNHADGCGSVWEATRRAADFRSINRRLSRHLLEAEARTVDEVHQALDAGAERVLLDNMSLSETRRAVADVRLFCEATGHRVTIEASGGMTPVKARQAARAGVDFVSVGAITHSVKAIDIALDVRLAARGGRGRTRSTSTRPRLHVPVLVIGSGIAGLSTALVLFATRHP